ncbi:hypothetical protein B0H16DRAFT_1476291 [Mycena metata]|uniref:Uncharacterized protein n=1 Tax=Mycena metata TaxID=1033252 RepID=A0AAD7HC57_9AGAR|nr:hypothetical protein B0H16DRAFT_1476291 [Mycena metata]
MAARQKDQRKQQPDHHPNIWCSNLGSRSYGANSRPKKPEAEILMKKRWENAPVRSGAARIVTVALRQSVTFVTILAVFSVHAGSTGDHCYIPIAPGPGKIRKSYISMPKPFREIWKDFWTRLSRCKVVWVSVEKEDI